MDEDITDKGAFEGLLKSKPSKDLLDAILNSFLARTWWIPRPSRCYFYRVPATDDILELNQEELLGHLIKGGFFGKISEPELVAKETTKEQTEASEKEAKKRKTAKAKKDKNNFQQFLVQVRETHRADWFGELAGIPKGLYNDNGFRCLIKNGPTYPEPKEGDCSFIEKLMSELFPGVQVHIMEALIARIFELKRDPDAVFICQIPILVGAKDCGKSLFKDEIFIPLLGGRHGDAISFISGSTFNSELGRADVWVIDDQNFDTRFDQDVTADRMKKFAADRNKRIEKKHYEAINVHIKAAMLILLNTGSKNLRLLPDRTEDIEDKILGFLCGKADVPTGKDHEKVIRNTIKQQLPAYLYKLLYKRTPPPGVVSEGRFGIVPYYHPELLKMREAEDYAISILELVEKYMKVNRLARNWMLTAGELFHCLIEEPSYRITLLGYCRTSKQLGWQLSKLIRMRPESVTRSEHRTKTGFVYTFAGPPDLEERHEPEPGRVEFI